MLGSEDDVDNVEFVFGQSQAPACEFSGFIRQIQYPVCVVVVHPYGNGVLSNMCVLEVRPVR